MNRRTSAALQRRPLLPLSIGSTVENVVPNAVKDDRLRHKTNGLPSIEFESQASAVKVMLPD